MAHIAGVDGPQYLPQEIGYTAAQRQYASSTYQTERNLSPGLIVVAKDIKDIQKTVVYAKNNHQAIAIRTGGHQYSGASSTSPNNILLDVSKAFMTPDDLKVVSAKDGLVRVSISHSLQEFIAFLQANSMFVPTGQCKDVHLGGHVQTGGYGQLARSFGLFADHVISLEVVDHNGDIKEINKTNAPDMFWAFLGGSPGNFGVITHANLQVHLDKDYSGSLGLLSFHIYTREKLKYLLDILVKMSDDPSFPRNYDLCVSALSQSWKLKQLDQESFDEFIKKHPHMVNEFTGRAVFPGIAVYAQWVKLSPDDKPNMDWFMSLIKDEIPLINKGVRHLPMSQMVDLWLFDGKREFDYPYVKRTYLTPSNTLEKDNWTKWISEHIDKILWQWANGLFVSAQLQCFGGQFSKFHTNANNGTSYSWRKDSTFGCTLDCFHYDDAAHKNKAEEWEAETDTMIGPNGSFAKEQRRVLWGSFGDWDMKNVWKTYYESEGMYKKLQGLRATADPEGTFTPNVFCVPRGAQDGIRSNL